VNVKERISLFRDGVDRDRMIDMDRRLQPVRRSAFAVLAVALLACGPWLGWWTLAPLAVAGLLFALADSRIESSEHPEYAIFAAWVASEVIIAASVAIAGGPTVATMSWFAIPIVTLGARFSGRVITVGVAITLGLMVAVAFGVDSQAVLDDGTILLAPIALVLAIAILSTALMRSDLEHRNDAVIDQLTGMLNRKALVNRKDELAQQSRLTGEPVAVLVGDLDNFKEVNDSVGHTAGDAVLRDVAYVLRKELRAFDLAYRLGGEEFLVLVPGSDEAHGAQLAERLRAAVARARPGGEAVTISFGVSASPRGRAFDYDEVFVAADAALYEAKRSGRDLVCLGSETGLVALV
jgi:diguanylate cyclase (GGDEF)-like protein